MNKQLRDLTLKIKDLEAELDYYNLYEPDDRESADRLKRLIDKTYDEYDDLKKRKEKPIFNGDNENECEEWANRE